jgi:hypothetical protein
VGGVTAGDLNSDMQNNTGPRSFYKSYIFLPSETELVSPEQEKHSFIISPIFAFDKCFGGDAMSTNT